MATELLSHEPSNRSARGPYSTGPSGLSFDDLTLTRRGLTLVANLSLDVRQGETLAITGRSGAGKTTLLRTVAGLDSAPDGSMRLPSERVGVVFQDPRLLPWRTAIQNIELVCPTDDRACARRWLDAVGLSDAADLYPAQLSGGMRQRVAVARALAFDAPLVVVDEPFASLDAETATTLRDDLVAHLARTTHTTLWVTHNTEEASAVAPRTLHLDGPPTGAWRLIDHTPSSGANS